VEEVPVWLCAEGDPALVAVSALAAAAGAAPEAAGWLELQPESNRVATAAMAVATLSLRTEEVAITATS
jgi:hypothetical protein